MALTANNAASEGIENSPKDTRRSTSKQSARHVVAPRRRVKPQGLPGVLEVLFHQLGRCDAVEGLRRARR
eukprot:5457789-Lingulodinium_polyedra.AAC.1